MLAWRRIWRTFEKLLTLIKPVQAPPREDHKSQCGRSQMFNYWSGGSPQAGRLSSYLYFGRYWWKSCFLRAFLHHMRALHLFAFTCAQSSGRGRGGTAALQNLHAMCYQVLLTPTTCVCHLISLLTHSDTCVQKGWGAQRGPQGTERSLITGNWTWFVHF